MYKNLKNVFKHPSPDTNVSTSPARSEVLKSVFNATTLNVMLERERSELSRASRNFMAILLNAANSTTSRFFSVITGRVPVILVQQWINLVNKLAILLHKYRFSQNCRNRLYVMSGDDKYEGRLFMFFPFLKLLNRIYHPGSSANELTLKAKDDNKRVLQQGRSMIEMLGVLAIIAVLSVGGIAGYSKAMEKFKVNKATEEYSYLIHGLLEHLSDIQRLTSATKNSSKAIGILDYIRAAQIIPETWENRKVDKDEIQNAGLTDSYGNTVNIFSRREKLIIDLYLGTLNRDDKGNYSSASFSPKFCESIFNNLLKPLSPIVYDVYLTNSGKKYFGNNLCNKSVKCLRDITLNEIHSSCNYCTGKFACGIIIEF